MAAPQNTAMITSGRGWGSHRSASTITPAMTTRDMKARNAVTGHQTGLELAVSTNSRKKYPSTTIIAMPSITTASQTRIPPSGSRLASCATPCTRRVCVDPADCGRARWGRGSGVGPGRVRVRVLGSVDRGGGVPGRGQSCGRSHRGVVGTGPAVVDVAGPGLEGRRAGGLRAGAGTWPNSGHVLSGGGKVRRLGHG